ncbi:MAG: ATP-binding protein [Clostridia bacterium]|nr:ATP-binding protein [Clostridia bacterium]
MCMNTHNSRKLHSLVIFRNILKDETISKLIALFDCDETNKNELTDKYCDFAQSLLFHGGNLSQYMLKLILEDENLYTTYKITGRGDGELLEPLLERELKILEFLAQYEGEQIRTFTGDTTLARWKTEDIDFADIYHKRLCEIHRKGFGIYAKYHMFILGDDGEIIPIKNPDPQKLSELSGYERERNLIIANTKALLEGKPANNVLLYGDAGTGKSSTVKAIGNEFYEEGLRIIELKKEQLHLIPELLDNISEKPLKFIIFIDDLTFASDDRDFCALKATLEGGVSSRGNNTIIYVTSNHRHLVKETNSDRQGDEISVGDKIQEIVSLSARFGLTITYSKPDKDLYCQIVSDLAKRGGITLEEEKLFIRAEAFAIRHGGRNPRTAKQFVDILLSGVESI